MRRAGADQRCAGEARCSATRSASRRSDSSSAVTSATSRSARRYCSSIRSVAWRARARTGVRVGFRLAVGGLARLGTGQVDRPERSRRRRNRRRADRHRRQWRARHRVRPAIVGVVRRAHSACSSRTNSRCAFPTSREIRSRRVSRADRVSATLATTWSSRRRPRYVYNDYLSAVAALAVPAQRRGQVHRDVHRRRTSAATRHARCEHSRRRTPSRREQRVGGGASCSTLRAFDRGRARLPLEIQFAALADDERVGLRPEAVQHAVSSATTRGCSARRCGRECRRAGRSVIA